MGMFIAIAPKGKEYIYRRNTRLSVSKASAQKIAEILTDKRYWLNEGEVWHSYDTEYQDEMYGKATIRKGIIRVTWDGHIL